MRIVGKFILAVIIHHLCGFAVFLIMSTFFASPAVSMPILISSWLGTVLVLEILRRPRTAERYRIFLAHLRDIGKEKHSSSRIILEQLFKISIVEFLRVSAIIAPILGAFLTILLLRFPQYLEFFMRGELLNWLLWTYLLVRIYSIYNASTHH